MSADELKTNLIHKIQGINDPFILKSILKIVELEEEMHNKKVYQLTPEFEQKLEQTLQDVKAGYYLTEDEANRMTDTWLNE